MKNILKKYTLTPVVVKVGFDADETGSFKVCRVRTEFVETQARTALRAKAKARERARARARSRTVSGLRFFELFI